jgi:hypothetical protein
MARLRTLLRQWMRLVWSLTLFKAGIRIPIRRAMIAITTNNSMSVKPVFLMIFPFSATAEKEVNKMPQTSYLPLTY